MSDGSWSLPKFAVLASAVYQPETFGAAHPVVPGPATTEALSRLLMMALANASARPTWEDLLTVGRLGDYWRKTWGAEHDAVHVLRDVLMWACRSEAGRDRSFAEYRAATYRHVCAMLLADVESQNEARKILAEMLILGRQMRRAFPDVTMDGLRAVTDTLVDKCLLDLEEVSGKSNELQIACKGVTVDSADWGACAVPNFLSDCIAAVDPAGAVEDAMYAGSLLVDAWSDRYDAFHFRHPGEQLTPDRVRADRHRDYMPPLRKGSWLAKRIRLTDRRVPRSVHWRR